VTPEVGVCCFASILYRIWDWEEQDPDRARAILLPTSGGGGDEILDPRTPREESPQICNWRRATGLKRTWAVAKAKKQERGEGGGVHFL